MKTEGHADAARPTDQTLEHRLNRLLGQIRGIEEMSREGRSCCELLQQLHAATAALRSMRSVLLRRHVQEISERLTMHDHITTAELAGLSEAVGLNRNDLGEAAQRNTVKLVPAAGRVTNVLH
jgi:DNA-binding FrmR family transcriptional regulator